MEPDYFDLEQEERMWPTNELDWIDELNHMDDRDYDYEDSDSLSDEFGADICDESGNSAD